MPKNLSLVVDGDGIATIRFDVPGRSMNVLSSAVIDEFAAAVDSALADPAVRGILVTSGKPSFMPGADLTELAQQFERQRTPTQARDDHAGLSKLLRRLETGGKPVAAAINGVALGGGFEICLACHYRVLADDPKAQVGLPEVKVGLLPGAGGTQRLPRLVGIEKAAEMLRTCRPISSEKAKAYGLIREEVDGDLVGRAVQLAKDMASGKAPRSRMAEGPMGNVPANLPAVEIGHLSKKVDEILCKAILGGARLPLKDAIPFEAKCFGEVCGTEDMRIGVDNFVKNGPKAKAAFVHR